jgi:hypothetical protein
MRHRILICLSFLLFYHPAAFGASDAFFSVRQSVPQAAIVGRGMLSYAVWDIYEATLYAPNGKWNPAQPFALSIKYYHALKGAAIADRSVEEMRKQGFQDDARLADWNAQMKKIFPDVENGSVLSAVYAPGRQTTFYNGAHLAGVIQGDAFAQKFFGIWLSEKTSEPKLRRALLGLS